MKFIFWDMRASRLIQERKTAFDPFLTGNGLAEEAASKVECDYIFFPMPMRIIWRCYCHCGTDRCKSHRYS